MLFRSPVPAPAAAGVIAPPPRGPIATLPRASVAMQIEPDPGQALVKRVALLGGALAAIFIVGIGALALLRDHGRRWLGQGRHGQQRQCHPGCPAQ